VFFQIDKKIVFAGLEGQIIAFGTPAKVSVTGQAAAAKMRVLIDVYVNVKAPLKKPLATGVAP
jgi:hypothetical protein